MNTDLDRNINRRYILSISDEPKKLLPPIFGYAREPLLSLEEACEPLLNIVPRLSPHIWVAKENSKNPSDGLTHDESAAIRLYTMEWDADDVDSAGSLYIHLNRSLRMTDRTILKPWFRYLKLFLTAMAKLKVNPNQRVWRGVPRYDNAEYSIGSEVIWWAFSSCTTSLNVLESALYLGNVGARTLFSIETFNGREVHHHSHFIAEDEILLLPGSCFEVKSRLNPAPDLYIIHLSQKRPLHDLLEPPFEGAQLTPLIPSTFSMEANIDVNKPTIRPWYKRKTFGITIAFVVIVIILVVVLGAVFGTRNKNDQMATTTNASVIATTTTTMTATVTATTMTTSVSEQTSTTSNAATTIGTNLPEVTIFDTASPDVGAIWNAASGKSGFSSSEGTGEGQYYTGQGALNALDGSLTTMYRNFGSGSNGILTADAGLNTGLYAGRYTCYVTLKAFKFGTSVDSPERDPITVRVEGTNYSQTTDYWNLIYTGPSGLSTDPGRSTFGYIQTFSNAITYIRHRVVVVSKRGTSDSVSYSEIKFYGACDRA